MKMIVLTISFILTCIVFAQVVSAQSTLPIPQTPDSLQNKVMKLMEFYDSYDDGSPESLKKAKYNDAVDEISGGTASEKAKSDAYKIIDAYIKGDKAKEQQFDTKESNDQDFDEAIKETKEAQAGLEFLAQQKSMFMQMSYADFETYISKNNPFVNKKDIQNAYNEMHKKDGKHVAIDDAEEKMNETQKQMWAIGVLQNPKNYEEFRKACKILNPKISDSEIKKAWDSRIK